MPHLDPSAVQCIIAIAKEYLTSLQKTENLTNKVKTEIDGLGKQILESKSRLNDEAAYNKKQEELILLQKNYIDSLHGELSSYKEGDTTQSVEAAPGHRLRLNRAGSTEHADTALPLIPLPHLDALPEAGIKPTKEFLNVNQLDNEQDERQGREDGYLCLDMANIESST